MSGRNAPDKLVAADETDFSGLIDERTLQYNREYFRTQERERAAAAAPSPRDDQAAERRRHRHHRSSRSESQSQRSSNGRVKPAPGEDAAGAAAPPPAPVPTAPPSEDMPLAAPEGEEEAEPRYSITELVATIGNHEELSKLDPELQRRVLDFRLAQQKRREKYGRQKRWGIFGLYAHLSDLRIDLEWAEDAAWRRNNGRPYLSWADFDKLHNKGANRPWFTYFLLFICSIMMIVEFGLGGWKMAPPSENPMLGPSPEALVKAGARVTPLIVDEGQWFRIITPLFLHAGLIHFFINMAALWFVGAAVEQSHGIINAMILFFVPGVGGNILGAICLPQYISVGASGGIFGLIGGCLADITMHWHLLFLRTDDSEVESDNRRANIVAIIWLVFDILVNIIIGFTPYVDNFCHLGGLVYGFACGWSAIEPLAVKFLGVRDTKWGRIWRLAARFAGLIFSVVMIIVTTVILASMSSDSSPCSGCRYVSCIPFPPFREDKWWYCDDCNFVTATLYNEGNDPAVYTRIELTCPNKAIENIPINETDQTEITKHLPTYCREWCDDTFA